jgi:hypothetical protein
MTEMADPGAIVNEGDRDHPRTTQRPAKRRSKPQKPQTVFRNTSPTAGNFTIMPNALLQDERLRPAAYRMLTYVLSRPADWDVNLEWLAETLKLGRDRARLAVNELVKLRYARKWQARKGGSFDAYIYNFTDTPGVFADAAPAPENPSAATPTNRAPPETGNQFAAAPENPSAATSINWAPPAPEKPAPGNQSLTKKEKNKDSSTKIPPVVPQQAGGRRPSSYLPDDWTLPEADRAWALQHAPQLAYRIDAEVEAFRDWHAGKRRVDWSARWRTWVREFAKRATPRPAAAAPSPVMNSAWKPSRADNTPPVRRWFAKGTPEFEGKRQQLERDQLFDEVAQLDRAGGVLLSGKEAAGAMTGPSPLVQSLSAALKAAAAGVMNEGAP